MIKPTSLFIVALLLIPVSVLQAEEVPVSQYLQDISVTIKTDRGSGSGVIFTMC